MMTREEARVLIERLMEQAPAALAGSRVSVVTLFEEQGREECCVLISRPAQGPGFLPLENFSCSRKAPGL